MGVSEQINGYVVVDIQVPLGMDVTELAKELQTANPDLPSAEAEFMKAANAAQAEFNTGEIDRQEYQTRIRTATTNTAAQSTTPELLSSY